MFKSGSLGSDWRTKEQLFLTEGPTTKKVLFCLVEVRNLKETLGSAGRRERVPRVFPVSTGILPHSLPEWAFRARPGLWRICICPRVARIAEQKFWQPLGQS